MLFYLDPPYWGCERDYGEGMFSRAEFEAMAELLAKLSGRFILSLNDTPQIRQLFAGFMIEPVATTYSVGAAEGSKNRAELIIANVDFGTETAKSRTKSKWRCAQK
jgi:DNA adenine methylase